MLEKNVSDNDIFRLQDSGTAEIFSARLEEFGKKCPNTMLYLKAIPPEKWVLYAQVCFCYLFHFAVIDTAFILLTFDHSYRWVPLHLAGAVAILERLDKDVT
jgi:hypothetical protein